MNKIILAIIQAMNDTIAIYGGEVKYEVWDGLLGVSYRPSENSRWYFVAQTTKGNTFRLTHAEVEPTKDVKILTPRNIINVYNYRNQGTEFKLEDK